MEKLSYCFASWHCWNGVKKTKCIEQLMIQRHGKEVVSVGRGGGGVLCLKWKATLSFPTVSFLYGA